MQIVVQNSVLKLLESLTPTELAKAILLHAYIKKTEQTPIKELQRATIAKDTL